MENISKNDTSPAAPQTPSAPLMSPNNPPVVTAPATSAQAREAEPTTPGASTTPIVTTPPLKPTSEALTAKPAQAPAQSAPKLSAIRTFRGDISGGVQSGNVSMTNIALAEAARKRAAQASAPEPTPSRSRRWVVIALGVAGFALVGAAILAVIGLMSTDEPVTQSTGLTAPPSIIFTEEAVLIDTNSIADAPGLHKRIAQEISAPPIKNGRVVSLNFTVGTGADTRILTAQEFFAVMAPTMPSNLLRSLDESFLFGIYFHEKNEPFIILEPDSYENAFAGMLKWEASLAQEILPLFNRKSELSNTRNLNWADKVIRNIDARVEKDANGTVTLVYSFINRNTLVIASSEVGFLEALTRFHTPKPVTR